MPSKINVCRVAQYSRQQSGGSSMLVKLYRGVLHIGSKRFLALQGTLPGLVHGPHVGVWVYVCNTTYMASRLVLWEVVQS
jgi:hypothetical protein